MKKKEKKSKKSTKVDVKKKEIARKSRKRPKVEYNEDMLDEAEYQKQLDLALMCNSSNLDLSEEFIIFILKQVDELCENIKVTIIQVGLRMTSRLAGLVFAIQKGSVKRVTLQPRHSSQ